LTLSCVKQIFKLHHHT